MARTIGPSGRRVGFARWRSDLPSGGNRFDDELTRRLPDLAIDLREYPVIGPWPLPADHDRERLAELLSAEQDWLIGNIVASAAPELISAAVAFGRRITVLMHYFPADDPSLPRADRERLAHTEAAAVHAASAVVATSVWAARQVASRYGRGDAVVAVPGTDPAELARVVLKAAHHSVVAGPVEPHQGSAHVHRSPDQAGRSRLNARLVGPDTSDDDVTREVRGRIAEARLTDRIKLLGPQHGAVLEASWAQTDLLVHTSGPKPTGWWSARRSPGASHRSCRPPVPRMRRLSERPSPRQSPPLPKRCEPG